MVGRQIYRRRAQPSGVHLTAEDAAVVKAMRLRGDRQHDIAAWFGVNPGRIAEVLNGYVFQGIVPANAAALPPVGPYHSGRAAAQAVQALVEAKAALAQAEQKIRSATR
jgi:hypothetical protein